MKKILIVSAAVFCVGLFSCKENAVKNDDANVTVKENSIKFYKAMETGDEANIKSWINADAVDHNGSQTGDDIVGADKITAMITQIHTCFEPGFKMNVVSQAVDGDYLYSMVEMKGTTTANPGMGFPPSTKMDSKSVDVVKLKDGKAQEHWAYMSIPDVMMMMKGQDAMPHGDAEMTNDMKRPMRDTSK